MDLVYKAQMLTQGGRSGTIQSDDGSVKIKLAVPTAMGGKDKVTLSFDLANSGKVEGTEMVQLYLRDMVSSVVRPLKELKGFEKVTLAPGEKKTLHFTLGKDELTYWSPSEKKWVLESAVFGAPHPDFGEGVVAVVVARAGAGVPGQRWCQRRRGLRQRRGRQRWRKRPKRGRTEAWS